MEEEDFSKLPVEDACVHKLWKARLQGYTAAKKIFGEIEDEKSSDWNKFNGLVKKFVVDSHAMCQEKGLEAVLVYVENCGFAGKTTGDVVSGIIQKALAAPKARTKELGVQVILMYIEIEKHEIVLEELMKGTENKNPKVTAACVGVLTQALSEFGPKVIGVSKVVKKVLTLIEDRDQVVRQQTKQFITEAYRFLGPAIKPVLSNSLKPAVLSEIEADYEKLKDTPPRPTRLLRSQQVKEAAAAAVDTADAGGSEVGGGGGVVEETDPYDLLDPVDILSQLNKEFYTKLESKKWSERKEVVEELDKQLQSAPKLENADYGELLRTLKKVIQKDSNVVVVGFAVKCVVGIAKGLKRKFSPYAAAMMPTLFEKFKEKKQNVVVPLREAVDAVYVSTNLEALQEDILASLENKNPSIKSEVASFLARCFCKCTPTILNKKLLKALSKGLINGLTDSDPSVRESSANALGTAMKVVGEKAMAPFLVDIDATFQKKIKEYYDKAEVVVVKQAVTSKPASAKAAVKTTQDAGETPVVRPKATKVVKPVKPLASKGAVPLLKSSELTVLAKKLVPLSVFNDITSSDSERQKSGCEQLSEIIENTPVDEKAGQVLISLFSTHNFSPETDDLILRINLLKDIASKFPLPREKADNIFYDISKLLANPTYQLPVHDLLTAVAKSSSLSSVARVMFPDDTQLGESEEEMAIIAEQLNWISSCIKSVDHLYEPACLTNLGKKASEHSNTMVSMAGVKLIGFVHIKLDSQKDMPPPEPVAVPVTKSQSVSHIAAQEKEVSPQGSPPASDKPADTPKTDISPKLTEALMAELGDKNWKVRSEAVEKVRNIVNSANSITSNLGDAAPLIAARITDSNGKISANAIALVQSLAPAMGPACKKYITVFLPFLMKAIGDQKVWIRTAVINCFNVWGDICGYDKFFEGEVIADALKSGSPAVRAELWAWLALKLPGIPPKAIPKEELTACLSTLYSNLEDRNAEVRKNACEATLGIMLHLNYNAMAQALENIKGSGSSAKTIKDILDKTRGSLPVQSLQKSKSADKAARASTAKMAPGSSATIVKKPKASSAPSRPSVHSAQKKEEEEDQQALLQINNLKNQRFIDEQKLKVLKWSFTSVRPEFVELLKDQMMTANVNKTLMECMFHPDFRYHLRAIESLAEDMAGNKAGLKCNLDLILRWMTLKFLDTNPSVLLKGLEYLNAVFQTLIDDNYHMSELEAASFIPSLIVKAGDPKDAVRNSVRIILKQIASVYPASKQFAFLMDGLKSKNSRQRSECLDQLSWLIETYGATVFHPSMPSALKEIAKHIADRDNAVRSSALNCVVQAYYLEGEKVYKMVGQISDKDMSLLEERIKRASKNRPLNVVKPLNIEPQPPMKPPVEAVMPQMEEPVVARMPEENYEPDPQENMSLYSNKSENSPRQQGIPRPSSGAFGIDQTVVEEIEGTSSQFCKPMLVDIDLQFLKDSSEKTYKSVNIRLPKVTPTISTYSQPAAIKRELVNIASGDIDKAQSAIATIENILRSDKRDSMKEHIDHFILQLSHLMVILNQSSHPEVVNCYNTVFNALSKVSSSKDLCSQISETSLLKIIEQLIHLLATSKPNPDNSMTMFNRALNTIIVSFLENSNKTDSLCALLKIMNANVANPKVSKHFKELLIKCVWKMNKTQPKWDPELDYPRILEELHIFFKDYPSSWWKGEENDLPLRTAKTIIHTMVKSRGVAVKEILDSMPNVPRDSELYVYIKRVIRHLKLEDGHMGDSKNAASDSPREERTVTPRLTKTEHDELSAIFRMIGDVEESPQGLKRLHAFLKSRPGANVEPFLSKTTPQFQNFIRKGLQALDEQSSTPELTRKEPPSADIGSNFAVRESDFTEEAGVMWSKLKNMQEISGFQLEKQKEAIAERIRAVQPTLNNIPNVPATDKVAPNEALLRAYIDRFKSRQED